MIVTLIDTFIQVHSSLPCHWLSRPDLANPVRELSKVMDGAASAHKKKLKPLVDVACQPKDNKLKIKADSGELPFFGGQKG
jgi:hypothetical protein